MTGKSVLLDQLKKCSTRREGLKIYSFLPMIVWYFIIMLFFYRDIMEVPEQLKENIRAVLLSKTDGSGILVSKFISDYKSYIHQPLHFKELGYQNLEAFVKAIPDVCRYVEYISNSKRQYQNRETTKYNFKQIHI